MPRDPVVYADMLAERLRTSPTQCWLVNTGWSGGPCGRGERMPIALTRSLLKAALEGALDDVPTTPHPVFGVLVPTPLPERARGLLDPRSRGRPAEYDARAAELARLFAAAFDAACRAGACRRDARRPSPVAMSMREVAGATGLEPAASGVTGRRSNQLSYAPAKGR